MTDVLIEMNHLETLLSLAEALVEGNDEFPEHVAAIAAGNEALAKGKSLEDEDSVVVSAHNPQNPNQKRKIEP